RATLEDNVHWTARVGASVLINACWYNWISADGRTTPLLGAALLMEPVRRATVNGRQMPVAWRIRIPGKSVDIITQPLNDQAWMTTSTPYWEGPIAFTGTTSGVGYLEMTGY
ncbi:lipocalin family protein, partial [Rhizobium favelukesii]|uniref:lipocalin family protein n=1 Tax=Rhizobium favelukesii TaxID=348824 RepID=UPI002852E2C3